MKNPFEIERSKLKPFWHYMPAFFAYMNQEKLYFLLMGLSIAAIHRVVYIIIVTWLISGLLYLTLYKIAFEVLRSTARGYDDFQDTTETLKNDYVGIKAMLLPLLPVPIYIFIYPNDPVLAIILMGLVLIIIPASYMLMAENGSLIESLNPESVITIIQRIGKEYYVLTALYIAITALAMVLINVLQDTLGNWMEYILIAAVYNFSVVWVFHIIGFVLYRHAEVLGFDESPIPETELFSEDPIKERIELLLEQEQAEEALKTIHDLQTNQQRTDLAYLKSQAEDQLRLQQRDSDDARISTLIENQDFMTALEKIDALLKRGRTFRPENIEHLDTIIQYARGKQKFNTVTVLIKGLDKHYPQEHQHIVDNYFLLAKILFEQGKTGKAITLLNRTVARYEKTAKVSSLKSYLRGIHIKKR